MTIAKVLPRYHMLSFWMHREKPQPEFLKETMILRSIPEKPDGYGGCDVHFYLFSYSHSNTSRGTKSLNNFQGQIHRTTTTFRKKH